MSPRGARTPLAAPLLIALLAGALAAPARAEAHRPVFVGTGAGSAARASAVSDPAISWAFYGTLAHPSARQYFRFDAEAGDTLFLQLLVPARGDLAGLLPQVTLVGPSGRGREPWRRAHPSEPARRRVFFEPFTQTTYWQLPALRVRAPASGTYYAVVSAPAGATGPYVLALGTRETFGPADLARFPGWWWKARRHAGLAVWHGAALAGLALALVALLAARRIRR